MSIVLFALILAFRRLFFDKWELFASTIHLHIFFFFLETFQLSSLLL